MTPKIEGKKSKAGENPPKIGVKPPKIPIFFVGNSKKQPLKLGKKSQNWGKTSQNWGQSPKLRETFQISHFLWGALKE